MKKAQIQIYETITVLFIFFLLVGMGFIFYAKVFKGNVDVETYESSQKKSITIAQRVMFLPELQCTEDNIIKDNCIDLLKLEAAQKVMKQNEIYYYDLLEYSTVNISQIYPANPVITNLYTRSTQDFKNSFVTFIPILLFDPRAKSNSFGILAIETVTK